MTDARAAGVCRPGPRSSIVLTLLFVAVLSGCKEDGPTNYQQEKNKKEALKNSLQDQGAKITRKNYPPYGTGYVVNLSGAQIADNTFQTLKNLERVSELDLSKSSLTDDQMDRLNEIAYLLTKLDLRNTAVTDAGLQKLTNLNVCFNLYLAGTKVTKAGVENFTKQRLARPITKVKKMKVHMK